MTKQPEDWMTQNTDKILADIRSEVATQKACITQYSVQAIAFAAVVWGLVFKLPATGDFMPLYLCGTLVAFMLIMIARLANHKYSTVNRNLGYELHLCRLKDYMRVGPDSWRRKLLEVGWEEAMCAWRVVQPMIFETVYYPSGNFLFPHRKRPEFHKPNLYTWYDTNVLIAPIPGAVYHPGNYLRNMHLLLHSVAGFCVFIMLSFYVRELFGPPAAGVNPPRTGALELLMPGVLIIGIAVFLISQVLRHNSFRRILEAELLSIQSCAVVWRVVVTCHVLAANFALHRHKSYKFYTRYTAGLAADFNKHFRDPHDWLTTWERWAESETVFRELDKLFPREAEPPAAVVG